MSRLDPDPFLTPDRLAIAFNKLKQTAAAAKTPAPVNPPRARGGRGVRAAAVVLGTIAVTAAAVLIVARPHPVGTMALDVPDEPAAPVRTPDVTTSAAESPEQVAADVDVPAGKPADVAEPEAATATSAAPVAAVERGNAAAPVAAPVTIPIDMARGKVEVARVTGRMMTWTSAVADLVRGLEVPRLADPVAAARERAALAEARAAAERQAAADAQRPEVERAKSEI